MKHEIDRLEIAQRLLFEKAGRCRNWFLLLVRCRRWSGERRLFDDEDQQERSSGEQPAKFAGRDGSHIADETSLFGPSCI